MMNSYNLVVVLRKSIYCAFIKFQMMRTDVKFIKGKLTEDQYLIKMNILNKKLNEWNGLVEL